MRPIDMPSTESMSQPPPEWTTTDVLDLPETFQHAWKLLCHAYDVTADIPDMQTLFEGTDLTKPRQTAEAIVVHMLEEIVEEIGRFSPWYKQPAAAFGLALRRDPATDTLVWSLSREGAACWAELLAVLTLAVQKNASLIQAADHIDGMVSDNRPDPSYVMAGCSCKPPHIILVRQAILLNMAIVCDSCCQPFRPISDTMTTGDRDDL